MISTDTNNCLAVSLSHVLDIPLEEIPSFHEMKETEWKLNLTNWLADKAFSLEMSAIAPKGKAIAVGKHQKGVQHAVVVNDGDFIFDPDSDGVFLDSVSYYMSVKPLNIVASLGA